MSDGTHAYVGVKKKKSKQAKEAEKKPKKKSSKKGEKEKVEISPVEDTNIRIENYQMLEPIGKGGFGIVYRGLNLKKGATVAVKRVNLHGIPQEELEGIEMEIKLLQNLSHPNIVKYIDAIRTEDFLNIVLEFVENGALSNLLSKLLKHGYVEENLVAVYTYQILEGLKYLHEQGVIHRDIKGANILSTKDGIVKLADFGVATKLNDSRKSDSVVGTPYWMAPEIIEMTGQQSSACDIWSVGCTVVELITGKPPYFDLQQMPALFRIVQDEHPPLPDNISAALEDFLMQCFQKDPLRRVSAQELLKHSWLRSAQQNFKEEARIKLLQDAEYKAKGSSADSATVPPLSSASLPLKKTSSASAMEEEDFGDFPDDDDNGPELKIPPAPVVSLAAPTSGSSKSRAMSIMISEPAQTGAHAVHSSNLSIGLDTASSLRLETFVEEDEDDLGFDEEAEEYSLEKASARKRKPWDEPAETEPAQDLEDVFEDLEFDQPDTRSDLEVKTAKVFMRHLAVLNLKV